MWKISKHYLICYWSLHFSTLRAVGETCINTDNVHIRLYKMLQREITGISYWRHKKGSLSYLGVCNGNGCGYGRNELVASAAL